MIGETLSCTREPDNANDRYAVAVLKDGMIIGHLPRMISKVCSLFLRRGRSITCSVTGRKRYSTDPTLEIPCLLLFKAGVKEIGKLNKLLARKIIKTEDDCIA